MAIKVNPDRYMSYVTSKSVKAWMALPILHKQRIELEDVIQEAVWFVHLRVIPNYKKGTGAKFETYLFRCLDNFFITWRMQRLKEPIYIDLESVMFGLSAKSEMEQSYLLADSFQKLFHRASPALRVFLTHYLYSRRFPFPKKLLEELAVLTRRLSITPFEFLQYRRTDAWRIICPTIFECADR